MIINLKTYKVRHAVERCGKVMATLPPDVREDLLTFMKLAVKYPEWFKAVKKDV